MLTRHRRHLCVENLERRCMLNGMALTSNLTEDKDVQIDQGQVVWIHDDGNDTEVLLYSSGQVRQLSNNSHNDRQARIDNGGVVWSGYDGNDWEIFHFDGHVTSQLTDNREDDREPQIDDGQIVWSGFDGTDWEIFLFDGATRKQLTSNSEDDWEPQIDRGNVTWSGKSGTCWEVFFYDGSTSRSLSINGDDNYQPQISNGQVVWVGWDGEDEEIFLFDGSSTKQLTNNDADDWSPQTDGKWVVWSIEDEDEDIVLFDGQQTLRLTDDDADQFNPKVDKGTVIWTGWDGEDFEIYHYDGTRIAQLTDNQRHDDEAQLSDGVIAWLGSNSDDAEIFLSKSKTPFALGTVDFLSIGPADPAAGKLWYELEAANDALLTAELVQPESPSSVGLALADADGRFLAESSVVDGNPRLEVAASAGTTYYLLVDSAGGAIDLSIANLVSLADDAVQVAGTSEPDEFLCERGSQIIVTVNGVKYRLANNQYTSVAFDGGAGNDKATLTGSLDGEVAHLYPHRGTFGNEGFMVTVNEVGEIVTHGGGGEDVAYLYDSPGDDTFISRKGYGKLSGKGFKLETFDFMYNYGYATTRDGGRDVAHMEDTSSSDKFKFDWPKPDQFFGKMYGGGVYYNRAKFFEQILATMTGEKDTARLFDSTENDTFHGQKDRSRLFGPGFDVIVSGYDTLAAYAHNGRDIAYLEDSDDDDTARARPHKVTLWGGDYADPTYEVMARQFDEYHIEGKHAGFDRAKLHDTVLNDHVDTSGSTASLYTNAGELDLLYEIAAFDWVRLYATSNGSKDTLRKQDPLDFELVYEKTSWEEVP
jgi:hypothetical protein